MQRPITVDFSKISWDDLRIFITTTRYGSFRRAGEELRINASTIARRIGRLETQLGCLLFNRLPEGVVLTREGAWVLSTGNQMERSSQTLRQYLDGAVTTRGVVRCSVTEGLGTYWIMPQITQFSQANPYTVVDLMCNMGYADLVRLQSDVAIQLTRPTQSEVKMVKLGRMHVCLFASQQYIDLFGMPRTRADLDRHRLIDQISPQLPDGILSKLLGLDNIEGQVAVRTDASSAHFYAIELGAGIGLLPTYAIPLGAKVIPIDLDVHREVDIWLAYNSELKNVPRVSMFVEWLREIFDPHKYPWFRDNFVTPLELQQMNRQQSVLHPKASGVIAHPTALRPTSWTGG